MSHPAIAVREDYRPHPLADTFPLMDAESFAALVEDIRKHGQREAIVMFGGMILDGRNRWRACREAGVEPATVELPAGVDPLAFVVSKNIHRRHLTEGQRAMIAESLWDGGRGARRDIVNHLTMSAKDASQLMGISRPLLFQARTVRQFGTPAEVASVENGEAKVTTLGNHVRARAQDEGKLAKLNGRHGPSIEYVAPVEPIAPVAEAPPKPKRKGHNKGKGGIKSLPEGMTVEAAGRRAIELRKELGTFEAVPAHLGLPRHTIREVVNIVQMADRTDLSERDAKRAATALRLMNENKVPIAQIYQPVRDIAERLWGGLGAEKRNKGHEAREAARLDRFDRGLGIMLQACANATKIEIPHLAADHAKQVLKELAQAVTNIGVLANKIRGIHQ